MPTAASTFGDLLREYRVLAGLSQGELAEGAGVSEAAVGALERGIRKAPHRGTVLMLAKALDLNTEQLAALEAARSRARSKPVTTSIAHNVAPARTSFVGRETDVARILTLLRRSRLVTVTGSGGVGKTRVAQEAARQLLGAPYPEIWFVDLGPLIDGNFIPARIASTIQPELTDRAESIAALVSAIADRRMLLILDNCEHVVAQIAEAADAILESCPGVAILATSRERLNVTGEFVYRLPSLLLEPATELFIARAEAVGAHAAFSPEGQPTVIDVARRLDGIPLAIELAAAQLPALGLESLRTRLREYLNQPSGRPDLPARQQTVNATVAWSYDLLESNERALLEDLSIFAGGFTLSAVQAVCARDGTDRVVSTLTSLVSKSLVDEEGEHGGVRYGLLESVRAFALERLQQSARHDVIARCHAQWLATIGDDVENEIRERDRLVELVPELDNVRVAVSWALNASEQHDRALAGHILTGLFGLWDRMGRHREHRQWVETALERIDEERHPLVIAYLLRDLMLRTQPERIALDPIDRAIRLCEASGDEVALVKLLNVVAQVQTTHGMLREAEESLSRGYELLIQNHMERSESFCSYRLSRSSLRVRQSRFDEAREDLNVAEAIALSFGKRFTVVRIYSVRRAELEYAAGQPALALEIAEGMLDSEFGTDPAVASLALWRIPVLRMLLGDTAGAVAPLRDLLLLSRGGNNSATLIEIEYAALGLALLGKPLAAARLMGTVRAREQNVGFNRSLIRRDAYKLLNLTLQHQLGEDTIADAGASGARLMPDEAVDEALAALDASIQVEE